MRAAHIGALLFLSIVGANAKIDEYCSICPDHTMCKYQGFGGACENIGDGGVTEDDKRWIVDLHNWYRRLIARGLERRGLGGPQPSGANLMKFTWDEELARVAQAWADQCLFQHDSCRDVKRWKVGQNLYWSWRFPITTETNWTAAIESWYEEVEKFNPKTVQSYKFEAPVGHYTQLVWHDTNLIGCGRRTYGPNKLYVCNYGPAGNWINDPVYAVGAACSKCPPDTVCNDGLCESKPITLRTQPDCYTYGNCKNANADSEAFGKIVQSLTPPRKDAPDTYVSYAGVKKDQDTTANKLNLVDDPPSLTVRVGDENGDVDAYATITTTEIPINFNIIDDLDVINTDEEIKKEIEDLKRRILDLAQKIIKKRNSKN